MNEWLERESKLYFTFNSLSCETENPGFVLVQSSSCNYLFPFDDTAFENSGPAPVGTLL